MKKKHFKTLAIIVLIPASVLIFPACGKAPDNTEASYDSSTFLVATDSESGSNTQTGTESNDSLESVSSKKTDFSDGQNISKPGSTTSSKGVSSNTTRGETDIQESPLANTFRLLTTGQKKLTIGYIGGSITLGSSAIRAYNGDGTFASTGGDIKLSWVNRTSAWFLEKFPGSTIETVNAGVSDTATNFGLFRLEKTLMNTNGHDMPDLIFIEFTSNDWIYATQNQLDLQRQLESIFRNIYQFNPFAEIVVAITARGIGSDVRSAHINIARHYGVPFVDMGVAMQKLMTQRGTASETSGNYYYTVDNLHPSYMGYGAYFDQIKKVLEPYLNGLNPQKTELYNYLKHLPVPKTDYLIPNPTLIPAADFNLSGNISIISIPTSFSMYGTAYTPGNMTLVDKRIHAKGDNAQASFSFKGTSLGLLFQMGTCDINISYRIDNSEWKTFAVDSGSFGFQRYDHAQVYMLAHTLNYDNHLVELKFNKSGTQEVNVELAAALVGGEAHK